MIETYTPRAGFALMIKVLPLPYAGIIQFKFSGISLRYLSQMAPREL